MKPKAYTYPSEPSNVLKWMGRVDPETGECIPCTSRAKQEFKDECDLNKMLERLTKTGRISQMRTPAHYPSEETLGAIQNYHQALTLVSDVKSTFRDLPADLRSEFDNDEELFVQHLSEQPDLEAALHELMGERLRAAEEAEEAEREASLSPEPVAPSEPGTSPPLDGTGTTDTPAPKG